MSTLLASLPLLQELAKSRDKALVGGKAVNLGQLLRWGLPVPDGFVITTEAYRASRGANLTQPGNALAEQILQAWQKMGAGRVAVRSSATAEDLAEASMAGQYETFLDVASDVDLLDAIHRCWASLDTPRTRSYLAEHGIDLARVAMAVVVQKLVPADVAGVAFTANPHSGSRKEMLIEASWGLGEAVVSGLVQPDVLRIDLETGAVIETKIADKQVCVSPVSAKQEPVEESRRGVLCIGENDIAALWRLGKLVAEHFASPQDLEWAIHEGKLYLLQSRPITTLEHAEAYERVLQSTREELRKQLQAGRGPWILHNISETLKHATPLTWSVIQRFMSGAGGFGEMYRHAGFEPSARVSTDGFLHKIAGKAFMDLSLSAEMFFEEYPFKYDLQRLRQRPEEAQSPPTIAIGSVGARIRAARRIAAANRRMEQVMGDLDRRLRSQIIPAFVQWCGQEKGRDLRAFSPAELIELWQAREKRVMDEFAPLSLLPSLIAGMVLANLRSRLEENFWDEDPDELAEMLSAPEEPDLSLLSSAQLHEVALGKRQLAQWLDDYGHRAPGEFDLATPRGRENPDAVRAMAQRLKSGANPLALHAHRTARTAAKWAELRGRLSPPDLLELEKWTDLARRYLPFREDGKHYLMLGYDLLRDVALEVGRRLQINSDVFQLSREEMFDALRSGTAPAELIAQRKITYAAEQRIALPPVIAAEEIDTLGQGPALHAADSYPAFALSTGSASGPARIVFSPEDAGDLGSGYILVCPSTDPGWTPLFVNAAGLVLECGGALSHGAVVAREMNIPAVVLPGATELIKDGQTITVDGRNGAVRCSAISPSESTAPAAEAEPGPDDIRIARPLVPPAKGRRERSANKIAKVFCLIWGVYLAGVYLLPPNWLHDPSLKVLDVILWPVVRALGKPAAVAVVAAAMAAGTMLFQRFLTDNARLREAKRRSAELMKQAARLPRGTPRRGVMIDLASAVQMRIVAASLVPLAVLLGPMIMTFVWLPARVVPAVWNAPPGSPVTACATVASNVRSPVHLAVASPLRLDETSPADVLPPPVAQTLERLAADPDKLAAEIKSVEGDALAGRSPQQLAADLRAYLAAGPAPQTVSWRIRAGENAAGRFPITVSADGSPPLTANVVLGDVHAPEPVEVAGNAKSGLISLKLVYPARNERPQFWSPMGRLGESEWAWMIVYLVVYVPVMFGVRWMFRVA